MSTRKSQKILSCAKWFYSRLKVIQGLKYKNAQITLYCISNFSLDHKNQKSQRHEIHTMLLSCDIGQNVKMSLPCAHSWYPKEPKTITKPFGANISHICACLLGRSTTKTHNNNKSSVKHGNWDIANILLHPFIVLVSLLCYFSVFNTIFDPEKNEYCWGILYAQYLCMSIII